MRLIPTILRFVAGGVVVAALPLIAKLLGSRVAGIAALIPVVSLTGFYVLGSSRGMAAVSRAAIGGLTSLPGVAAFLLATYLAARAHSGLWPSLLIGMAGWCLVAVPLAVFYRMSA